MKCEKGVGGTENIFIRHNCAAIISAYKKNTENVMYLNTVNIHPHFTQLLPHSRISGIQVKLMYLNRNKVYIPHLPSYTHTHTRNTHTDARTHARARVHTHRLRGGRGHIFLTVRSHATLLWHKNKQQQNLPAIVLHSAYTTVLPYIYIINKKHLHNTA